MNVSQADLDAAVRAGIIQPEDLARLAAFLQARAAAPKPRFDLSHVLWYAGALIVMSAMGLFSTLAFASMGGTALTITAVVYAAVFSACGHYLWHRQKLRVPGGLLICIAISMVPLGVYGIQSQCRIWGEVTPGPYRDFFNWSEDSWLYMEAATIAAATLALWRYKFPFIVFIIAIMLWFMSMDLGAWFSGYRSFSDDSAWPIDQTVSLIFGVVIIAAACVIDRRRFESGDYAFWLHIFGAMTFWGAITSHDSDSEILQAAYSALNIGLVLFSVFLMRPVYAVLGALGLALYLGHLAYDVFQNSLLFPFALSLIGIGVIGLGLLYTKKRLMIAGFFGAHLPRILLNMRPAHARG